MTLQFHSIGKNPPSPKSVTLRTILALFDAGVCTEEELVSNLCRLMVARAIVCGGRK
jgi:hypothetical protein